MRLKEVDMGIAQREVEAREREMVRTKAELDAIKLSLEARERDLGEKTLANAQGELTPLLFSLY